MKEIFSDDEYIENIITDDTALIELSEDEDNIIWMETETSDIVRQIGWDEFVAAQLSIGYFTEMNTYNDYNDNPVDEEDSIDDDEITGEIDDTYSQGVTFQDDSREEILNANISADVPDTEYSIGDIVTFGHYDQDADPSNGKEAIEWLILDINGDTCTLISKYGLDTKPYNTEWTDVTWDWCSLRKWLNDEFLNAAFTEEEQAKLETVTVTADPNPEYDMKPGNDTQDKVFLLSIYEAYDFFGSQDAGICLPTQTAVANGINMGSGACRWWLRSPGSMPTYASNMNYDGTVSCGGCLVISAYVAVRPVIVLQLDSMKDIS